MKHKNFTLGGFCPGGFCPGGFVLEPLLSYKDKIIFKRSQAYPKIYNFTLNIFVKTMAVIGHVNSLIENKVNNY